MNPFITILKQWNASKSQQQCSLHAAFLHCIAQIDQIHEICTLQRFLQNTKHARAWNINIYWYWIQVRPPIKNTYIFERGACATKTGRYHIFRPATPLCPAGYAPGSYCIVLNRRSYLFILNEFELRSAAVDVNDVVDMLKLWECTLYSCN